MAVRMQNPGSQQAPPVEAPRFDRGRKTFPRQSILQLSFPVQECESERLGLDRPRRLFERLDQFFFKSIFLDFSKVSCRRRPLSTLAMRVRTWRPRASERVSSWTLLRLRRALPLSPWLA